MIVVRQLDDHVLVSGQIAPADVAALADQGVTVLVNNRPDDEDQGQPPGSSVEAAAEQAGIEYHFVPIARGIGPADVEAMQQAIAAAGDAKLLAFCRSGTRSALVCALARRAEGASAEKVIEMLAEAGFDPAPIAHLL